MMIWQFEAERYMYCKNSKYWDRKAWANSDDYDKTAPESVQTQIKVLLKI